MKHNSFLDQLDRHYPNYLKSVIAGRPFESIILRGGKSVPDKFQELSTAIEEFQRHEKRNNRAGWTIDWKSIRSQKHGLQHWPDKITVESEEDYLLLTGKAKEVDRLKNILSQLLAWRAGARPWLQQNFTKVLELEAAWNGIKAVVDFLLSQPLNDYYLRSIPVPVHTKFIEQYSSTILSIIRHLAPERCSENLASIESALGLKTKPYLFTIRILDDELQQFFLPGVEVFALSPESLRKLDKPVGEVWIVENTTSLYMLPNRPHAIAICGNGYALRELDNIPLLQRAQLRYWGDMDEDGYRLLSMFRGMYPNTESVLMDKACFEIHQEELNSQPRKYGPTAPLLLNETELSSYEALRATNGRIEQEHLKLDYITYKISQLTTTTD